MPVLLVTISSKHGLLLVWMIWWANSQSYPSTLGWWTDKTWVGVRRRQSDRRADPLCSCKSVSNIKLNILLMRNRACTVLRTEPRRLLTLASGYTPEGGKWSSLPVSYSRWWLLSTGNLLQWNAFLQWQFAAVWKQYSLAETEKMHLHFTKRQRESLWINSRATSTCLDSSPAPMMGMSLWRTITKGH